MLKEILSLTWMGARGVLELEEDTVVPGLPKATRRARPVQPEEGRTPLMPLDELPFCEFRDVREIILLVGKLGKRKSELPAEPAR